MNNLARQYKDLLPGYLPTMKEKGKATIWLPKAQAVQHERFKGYMNDRHFMMVDHDECPGMAHQLYDIEPNIVVYNPMNHRKHQAFWLLKDAVHCQPDAKAKKPYRYLRAIEAAFDTKYNADVHFSRYIHRNPLHWLADTDWRHDRAHSLAELAEVVDLAPHRVKAGKRLIADSNSRNVTLFNDLRFWAYPLVQAVRDASTEYDGWHRQVVTRAMSMNTFDDPMKQNDLLTVARSVAEFCYFRYRNQGATITTEYRAQQAKRGAIGGKISKGGGRPKSIDDDLAMRIELMLTMDYTQKEIAERVGVSTDTIKRYKQATINVK